MAQGYLKTPWGWLMVTSKKSLITSIIFKELCPLFSSLNFEIKDCLIQIQQYLKKERKSFKINYNLNKTKFQQEVLEVVANIAYGKTMTYEEIAQKINHPKAMRAVGTTLKNNPLAIVIPCHRVVNKNKIKNNYFYGLEIKLGLWEIEKII